MKHYRSFTILLFTCFVSAAYTQIDLQDSSVQAVTYWNMGEQYDYEVSLQTLKYNETDTLKNDLITYDATVSVIDSTEDSYTVRWHYKNHNMNTDDEFAKKIIALSQDIKVDVKIDALGVVLEVVNWEEVRDYTKGIIADFKSEIDDIPEVNQVLDKFERMYATKQAIENNSIQDVQQFHNFHGGKYEHRDTVRANVKTPNNYYPEKPFDSEVVIYKENIDSENGAFTLRSFQIIDSDQLTNTTYDYLSELAKQMGQEMISKEDIGQLTNVIETVATIHESGWLIESVQWKEVFVNDEVSLEIRTIAIK